MRCRSCKRTIIFWQPRNTKYETLRSKIPGLCLDCCYKLPSNKKRKK